MIELGGTFIFNKSQTIRNTNAVTMAFVVSVILTNNTAKMYLCKINKTAFKIDYKDKTPNVKFFCDHMLKTTTSTVFEVKFILKNNLKYDFFVPLVIR